MQFKYTNGFAPEDYCVSVSASDSISLADTEKRAFINITMSAASKVVTLGLEDGQNAIVYNYGGTNAFTVKNVSGDSGTSVGAGKVALILASTTANSTKVIVLN